MSTIIDDPSALLATRISAERRRRAWSLADLAGRSGVSKATLSKVERQEVSPTASVLARIAAALEITLAELVTPPKQEELSCVRVHEQPTWTDPATGYVRRQVFLSARLPLEIVEVDLPAGASVSFPASAYALIRQVLWMIEGRIVVVEGDALTELAQGDRLEFGPPADRTYRNQSDRPCRYLVVIVRQTSAR